MLSLNGPFLLCRGVYTGVTRYFAGQKDGRILWTPVKSLALVMHSEQLAETWSILIHEKEGFFPVAEPVETKPRRPVHLLPACRKASQPQPRRTFAYVFQRWLALRSRSLVQRG